MEQAPNFYKAEEWEIVPPPTNETPHQLLLRETGYDFTALIGPNGDYTWQEVQEAGLMDQITHLVAISPRVSLTLRRKNT